MNLHKNKMQFFTLKESSLLSLGQSKNNLEEGQIETRRSGFTFKKYFRVSIK